MGQVLNHQLRRRHPDLKPCHLWTVGELQALFRLIYPHRQPEHDQVYQKAADRRALRFSTLELYERHPTVRTPRSNALQESRRT